MGSKMNYTLPDSDKFSFDVYEEGRDVVVILKKAGCVQTKNFRNTGKTTVEFMVKHMSSLTEGQCDQWFKGLK